MLHQALFLLFFLRRFVVVMIMVDTLRFLGLSFNRVASTVQEQLLMIYVKTDDKLTSGRGSLLQNQ